MTIAPWSAPQTPGDASEAACMSLTTTVNNMPNALLVWTFGLFGGMLEIALEATRDHVPAVVETGGLGHPAHTH